jgi:uncharacterized phage protein (TIGR02218 family)
MKTISDGLKAHLASEVTTIATCYKITRKDNTVMCFTSLDKNIEYEGVTYISSSGFDRNEITSSLSFKEENKVLESILISEYIKEQDLLTGKYDNAEIEIFIVNYEDLTAGKMILFKGFFGKVSYKDDKFNVELYNLSSKLDATIGNFYTPTCRAKFCDDKCGLIEANYIFLGAINTVVSNSEFYCDDYAIKLKEAGYFNYGYVTFTSGNNNGISMEIKSFSGGNIVLMMDMNFTISVGDTFTIVVGCDKKFYTCKNKFSNIVNFRGEPHVPGMGYLLESK